LVAALAVKAMCLTVALAVAVELWRIKTTLLLFLELHIPLLLELVGLMV
jgi:hypothetical protein